MPSKILILNHTVGDNPANAYSVKLASKDATYGIKEAVDETVVVPNDTEVENTSIGVYEYDFNYTDNDKTYLVSWEIIPRNGDDPVYEVQLVGPFTATANEIKAVSDYKGTFVQGTAATLMLKVTNFDGYPIDPSSVAINIYDSDDNLVISNIGERVKKGFYIYDWQISPTQAIGDYSIRWDYVVDDITRTEFQDVVIAESQDSSDSIYYGAANDLRLVLESYLTYAQSIPVYFEQSRTAVNNKIFRFTFDKWNQTTGVKIYRNKKQIITGGFTINYFKGEVVFDDPLTEFDTLYADYNFRWFSDEDLHGYLLQAIRTLNFQPPHTRYSFENLPEKYTPIVVKQATIDALRAMMLALQFQQPQQVFGGPERASNVFSNLETLKKNYEEEVKDAYEKKKYGPYVGLTRVVVTPEFTLPGGRSRWFRYLFSGSGG